MERKQAFLSYQKHPWLNKVFKRLKKPEIEACLDFIERNKGLSKGDFDLAVNKMWVGKELARPKNWSCISELLSCANSAVQNSSVV